MKTFILYLGVLVLGFSLVQGNILNTVKPHDGPIIFDVP
jgi:hypothetical protein